jgi:D-3-phosphoglycerate dehydrogenase
MMDTVDLPQETRPMNWRILVSDSLDDEGLELLKAHGQVLEDPDLTALGEVDALIVRSRTKVTAQILAQAGPRLRVVGRAGVGVDNIDLEAAAEAGVLVVNAPDSLTIAVAEHALGLMLAVARHIVQADQSMRAGKWLKKELQGTELHGKTLGLLGVGRIGAALAKRAQALGMQILGHDALISAEAIQQRGAAAVDFETLLTQSDFLSLHVPLTDQTRDLIGEDALALAKRGLILISTARGGVIDEKALLAALEDGRVAGAGLDVFEQEPPGMTPLTSHPNVVCTPHLGSGTQEAQRKASTDVAQEVLRALRAEPLRWRVT